MFKRISNITLSLILLSICCAFVIKRPGAAVQEPKRVITEIVPVHLDAPVRIGKVAVGDQPITFGREFRAADGFLRDLQIELTNDSQKPVIYVSVVLKLAIGATNLPGNGKSLIIPYEFGDKSWKKGKPLVEPGPFLRPGESITVSLLSGKDPIEDPMESAKQNFQPKNYQFEIGVDIVMAPGDSMWRMGYWHKRIEPRKFAAIKNGKISSSRPSSAKMMKASFKTGAFAPCEYQWFGGYAYVNCGAIPNTCVYQVADAARVGGWYDYAGSTWTQCFHLLGGNPCEPSDYYVPYYYYCGIE